MEKHLNRQQNHKKTLKNRLAVFLTPLIGVLSSCEGDKPTLDLTGGAYQKVEIITKDKKAGDNGYSMKMMYNRETGKPTIVIVDSIGNVVSQDESEEKMKQNQISHIAGETDITEKTAAGLIVHSNTIDELFHKMLSWDPQTPNRITNGTDDNTIKNILDDMGRTNHLNDERENEGLYNASVDLPSRGSHEDVAKQLIILSVLYYLDRDDIQNSYRKAFQNFEKNLLLLDPLQHKLIDNINLEKVKAKIREQFIQDLAHIIARIGNKISDTGLTKEEKQAVIEFLFNTMTTNFKIILKDAITGEYKDTVRGTFRIDPSDIAKFGKTYDNIEEIKKAIKHGIKLNTNKLNTQTEIKHESK